MCITNMRCFTDTVTSPRADQTENAKGVIILQRKRLGKIGFCLGACRLEKETNRQTFKAHFPIWLHSLMNHISRSFIYWTISVKVVSWQVSCYISWLASDIARTSLRNSRRRCCATSRQLNVGLFNDFFNCVDYLPLNAVERMNETERYILGMKESWSFSRFSQYFVTLCSNPLR
jgi:hypothetical protein